MMCVSYAFLVALLLECHRHRDAAYATSDDNDWLLLGDNIDLHEGLLIRTNDHHHQKQDGVPSEEGLSIHFIFQRKRRRILRGHGSRIPRAAFVQERNATSAAWEALPAERRQDYHELASRNLEQKQDDGGDGLRHSEWFVA